MLSAICLVNYFEGGELPRDRVVLYRLCVEGLLHHWDQRRGIRSEFTLNEKLRVCREVALAMQADDRAEYEADKVSEIFVQVLNDEERAAKLLQHVRYRTGLLLERRPGVFAFAHLTFQEYLAARSVHEGNRLAIDAKRLVIEHFDARWKEVTALYCGLAPASAAIEVIEGLINQPNTQFLSSVLSEAYLSCGPEVEKDCQLRNQVLERIARAPGFGNLARFPSDDVAPIANCVVGNTQVEEAISETLHWLRDHPDALQEDALKDRLENWRQRSVFDVAELVFLVHRFGSSNSLRWLSADAELYASAGPVFGRDSGYTCQAGVAIQGLGYRRIGEPGVDSAFLQVLRILGVSVAPRDWKANKVLAINTAEGLRGILEESQNRYPKDKSKWPEFASLLKDLSTKLGDEKVYTKSESQPLATVIDRWVSGLDRKIGRPVRKKPKAMTKPPKAAKRITKKAPRKGKR